MIDYKAFLCKNSHKFSSQKIFHASDEIKNEIVELTSFFKKEVSLSERLKAIKNGFTHYTDDYHTFFNRVKFQKHKLSNLLESYDPSETEWENMKKNGYDRIWDCGTMMWIL